MPAGDRLTLAHGIGGAADLPISPELAIAGAVAALTISFTVLALAWRTPRFDAATSGRPAPAWLSRAVDATWFTVLARSFGLVWFGYTAFVAVFGPDLLTNPVFGIVYTLLWVGLVPMSLLFGPFYRAISPVRTINLLLARATGSDPDKGMYDYPARLGYWPAALGLYAFVWLELVYPFQTELGSLRLWCAAYVALMLVGGALFGNRFYEKGDPFEVYSTLVGKLSVWGRRGTRLVLRTPLANLDSVPVLPGLVAVVAVLFGSTAYDSFSASNTWLRYTQTTDHPVQLLENLILLSFVVGVAVLFAGACMLTGVGPEVRRSHLPDLFAHSVVPIVVGYIFAHYLSYLVEYGQTTLMLMSDPLGNGSNLLGTGDVSVNYWLSEHPSFLANFKVLVIVLGHVLGVVAAHDRAIKLLPRRHQVTGQLSLLVVMVVFTAGGLFLLFSA